MTTIEPMTAAEWPKYTVHHLDPVDAWGRVKAALEERERLLGRVAVLTDERDRAKHEAAEVRRLCETDASLGALIERIREHPMGTGDCGVFAFKYATEDRGALNWSLTEDGLTRCLSHLDSLLPKEPEVAPSGWTYERADKFVRQIDHEGGTLVVRRADSDAVPPCDREFVAKLMEASRAK